MVAVEDCVDEIDDDILVVAEVLWLAEIVEDIVDDPVECTVCVCVEVAVEESDETCVLLKVVVTVEVTLDDPVLVADEVNEDV